MARDHEAWIVDLLSPLSERQQDQLYRLLGALKGGLASSPSSSSPFHEAP
jgi:hypothetical protein